MEFQVQKHLKAAPLHQPHNLAPIRCLAERFPDLEQVACFDTAFHSTQPWQARTYGLPQALTDAEIDALIDAAVVSTGAAGMQDMGKVMGVLKGQMAGRADMAAVSARIKARLA